jgi:hypothetical protein
MTPADVKPTAPATRAAASRFGVRFGLRAAALLVGLPTLVVALAHVGPLRPVLGRLGRVFGQSTGSGCPVSLAGLTPQEIERHRAQSNEVLAGNQPARARAAGPFIVGKTMRRDVEAWATERAVSCREEQSATALRCTSVPSAALGTSAEAPPATDAFVRFDPSGLVVGVDIMRRECDGACAERLANELAARLERDVGPRSALHGELSAAYFDAPGLKTTMLQYRFSDFAADVSVMRSKEAGPVLVREQYRGVN